MNLKNIDLNLLVYLDVLLLKRNVTRSAETLGISQPAMSNGLQRLRRLFQRSAAGANQQWHDPHRAC